MNQDRRALLATALMLAGAAGAGALTPRTRRSEVLGALDLAAVIPTAFNGWREDTSLAKQIVDPQTQATIAATYTQTLSRTYVNDKGQRIMLSLAYGAELSDTGVGLHYPEVCYPAQGFKVDASRPFHLETPFGLIKARQLETQMAQIRFEPVTYWTMIGPATHYSGLDRKLAEIKLGLQGEKPDGLLFRISNITRETDQGFSLNTRFALDLLAAISPAARARLAGV